MDISFLCFQWEQEPGWQDIVYYRGTNINKRVRSVPNTIFTKSQEQTPFHQSRQEAKSKITAAGLWEIVEENKRYMKCRPMK